ncbi:hypothetical protein NVP1084O_089 [Vibrio phage 1.084.O._10N.261.49.F5]|nr:hypothetical protein NVP1084O_089 [Vibrio phage 1.084.O._10N.261.49.F5]
MKEILLIVNGEDKYAVSDFNVESWYNRITCEGQSTVTVGTQKMFDRIRLGVVSGDMKISHVCYGNSVTTMDEFGNTPRSYEDETAKVIQDNLSNQSIVFELLKKQIELKKTKRLLND